MIATPTQKETRVSERVVSHMEKTDDWIPFILFENEIIHFSSPFFFFCSSSPLFPPAPAVGVSVLDVNVFLSSHAEMSAFRGGRGRKSRFYYLAKLPCDGKILLKEWYLNNWSPWALKLQGLTVISSTKLEATSTKYSYHYLRMDIYQGSTQVLPSSLSISLCISSLFPSLSFSISSLWKEIMTYFYQYHLSNVYLKGSLKWNTDEFIFQHDILNITYYLSHIVKVCLFICNDTG